MAFKAGTVGLAGITTCAQGSGVEHRLRAARQSLKHVLLHRGLGAVLGDW